VIVSGAAGALLGTTIGFGLGRWRGEAILLRLGRLFRQKPARIQKLRRQFQEHGLAPVFIARFITGARNLAGLVAGSSGMRFGGFCAVSAAACVVWSSVITLEYYFAGHAILGAPTWLQILLIVVGIVATVLSFRLLRPAVGERSQGPTNAVRAKPPANAVEPAD
jgi:membrane protein DedA with SNARE-associated domain